MTGYHPPPPDHLGHVFGDVHGLLTAVCWKFGPFLLSEPVRGSHLFSPAHPHSEGLRSQYSNTFTPVFTLVQCTLVFAGVLLLPAALGLPRLLPRPAHPPKCCVITTRKRQRRQRRRRTRQGPEQQRRSTAEHHGADPLAGSPGRHPAVLFLHPVSLQSLGHAGSPDLRRQLEIPDLHRPGTTSRRCLSFESMKDARRTGGGGSRCSAGGGTTGR